MTVALRSFCGTQVGLLRLRAQRDAPKLRSLVERAVASADVEPPRLAPGAILIVRALKDPLPGKVVVAASPTEVDVAWEQACRVALDHLALVAVRPAVEPVPSDAEAVVFADEAELLSCLLVDLVGGNVASKWWWDLVLRRYAPAPTAAAILRYHAEAAPAVLHLLARRGRVDAVMASFTAGETLGLIETILEAHDVHLGGEGRRRIVAALVESVWQELLDEPDQPHQPDQPGQPDQPDPHETPDPTSRTAPSAEAVLLFIAELVYERPSVISDPSFRRHVAAARRSARAGGSDRAAPARTYPAAPPNAAPEGATAEMRAQGAKGGRGASDAVEAVAPPPRMGGGNDRRWVARGATSKSRRGVEGRASVADEGDDVADAVVAGGTDEPETPLDRGAATAIAGSFFLVNVLRRLDLVAALSARGRPLIAEVGSWGIVEGLARALLSAGTTASLVETTVADDIWAVFPVLDGRDPEDRLGRCPGGHDGRRPRRGRAGVRETSGPSLRGPLMEPIDRCFRDWLSAAAAFVLPELAEALRVEEVAVGEELLVHRGRLHVTRTHVDVVMPIDEISVPVRVAGLDADPGWVPDLGRVISFHYR